MENFIIIYCNISLYILKINFYSEYSDSESLSIPISKSSILSISRFFVTKLAKPFKSFLYASVVFFEEHFSEVR